MDEENKITLLDDEGNEVELYIEEQFIFEGKEYIVLYENEESEDSYLYRIIDDEEEGMQIVEIEDDDEYERVSSYYLDDEEEAEF
ncbi:MAG: DUF1292 domain-containing protein [Eubacteriaceae bacterium]|nr:DUF1292 domain-containing protein [Eubacteriaceae bacterium]MBQ1465295.1 DUF1292 domain-containing protein [Eubacteriaceae bacterium]MCR4894021.1 DUF1292 domain-containing protein [Eubacteriales bacterium]